MPLSPLMIASLAEQVSELRPSQGQNLGDAVRLFPSAHSVKWHLAIHTKDIIKYLSTINQSKASFYSFPFEYLLKGAV